MASYARGRNELRIGVLTTVSALIFLIMFMLLTDRGLSRQGGTIHVTLPTAEKLRKGDPILYRGVPVGSVRSIGFASDAGVVVRGRLKQRVPLTRDATASLVAIGFFGGQGIELHQGSPAEPLTASGDTLRGRVDPGVTDRIETIGIQAERLLADTTIALLHAMLGAGTAAGAGVHELTAAANSLVRESTNHIGDAAKRAATAAGNLEQATAGGELSRSLANLELATARLVRAGDNMEEATASLASALSKLDAGEGSLGRLINDAALYDRVLAAAGAVDGLILDVKANPRKYINLKVF